MPRLEGAKTISFTIYKGGTGKTTSAVNTAAALAELGKKVLLVDLDQQASATRHVGFTPGDLQYNLYHVFYQNVPASVVRKKTPFGFDLLPSSSLMAAIEESLEPGDERILRDRLAPLRDDVCIKMWKLDVTNAPRLVWLLTNTFLALSNLGLTLLDVPRFLADRQFREGHLLRTSIPAVRTYFEQEFPTTEKGAQQWIAPVLNKLGSLLFDPDVSLMFSGKSTIDFRGIMDSRMILLVNLPKGILSEGLSSLLAAFLVSHIQKAALSRAETPHRPPFYLYLDEFQNYTTDNITDILSESRKYLLSLTLAHQYLDQLPTDIRHAVLNTAGSLVSFRVGFDDARVLAKEVFLSAQSFRHVEPRFYVRQRGILTLPHLEKTTWGDLARELAILPPRQFWYRRRGLYQPVKEISFWLPDPQLTGALQKKIQELRDFSGSRFARRKADLKQPDSSIHQEDLPLWTA